MSFPMNSCNFPIASLESVESSFMMVPNLLYEGNWPRFVLLMSISHTLTRDELLWLNINPKKASIGSFPCFFQLFYSASVITKN